MHLFQSLDKARKWLRTVEDESDLQTAVSDEHVPRKRKWYVKCKFGLIYQFVITAIVLYNFVQFTWLPTVHAKSLNFVL